MKQESAEKLLYQEILEALGYSRNREPVLELAGRLPWRVIRGISPEAHTPPGPPHGQTHQAAALSIGWLSLSLLIFDMIPLKSPLEGVTLATL